MSGKKLTEMQKVARKVGKVLKACAIQCNEEFNYDKFRDPAPEEKVLIYNNACKMAMAELPEDCQFFLIDYYFVHGNTMFKKVASQVVQRTLGKTFATTRCPQDAEGTGYFVKVGSLFYKIKIEQLRSEILKYLRAKINVAMDDLLEEMRSKNKRRVLSIKKKYLNMIKISDMNRKHSFAIEDGAQCLTAGDDTGNYLAYTDLDDLARSLIRHTVLKELKAQAVLCGESILEDPQEN